MRAHFSINTAKLELFLDRLDTAFDMSIDNPMEQAMGDAMDLYMQAMRERFAIYSERGGTWAEHSPSTIKRRGPGAPILHIWGNLENSLERDMPDHVLEFTDHSVIEGTQNHVARYHQDGGKNLPARPIIVEAPIQTLDAMKAEIAHGVKISILAAIHG